MRGDGMKLELAKRATLVEARGSLRDVAFAPSEFGLKLVSNRAPSIMQHTTYSALAGWSRHLSRLIHIFASMNASIRPSLAFQLGLCSKT